MPFRPARICSCGYRIANGAQCPCQHQRAQARKRQHDANRPSASARGYDSKWRKEREAYLKVNQTCRRCGAPATVVNHVIPHKGNKKLFWSRSNWEPVCKPCHDGAIQSEEKRAAKGGGRFEVSRSTGRPTRCPSRDIFSNSTTISKRGGLC